MKPRRLYLTTIEGPRGRWTVVVPGFSVSDVEAYMQKHSALSGEVVTAVKEWEVKKGEDIR